MPADLSGALGTVPLAALLFVATNADDLVLLGILFARSGGRGSHIVLGQLAGIGALTAISYTASVLAVAIPAGWLPLIGLVPVGIGIKWLLRSDDPDTPEAASVAWWTVAGITLANGADNLAVYVPMFAIQTGVEKVVTGITFFFLTLVWCAIARWAVTQPTTGPWISRLLKRVAPFVLIGIGLWILAHHPALGFVERGGLH